MRVNMRNASHFDEMKTAQHPTTSLMPALFQNQQNEKTRDKKTLRHSSGFVEQT